MNIELSSGRVENIASKMFRKVRNDDGGRKSKSRKKTADAEMDDAFAEICAVINECHNDPFSLNASFAVTHFLLELVEFFLELLELQKPGLMVMGEDSCSEGRGFKSQHCILDGHFFTLVCSFNYNVCL